jgi:hypothetical protein
MNLMRNTFKKIVPVLMFILPLFFVGIFFGGSNALASDMHGSMMNCENDSVASIHDASCANENKSVQSNSSSSNTFMPCCLQPHDNSETTIPAAFQDRIKFSESSIAVEAAAQLLPIQQKTYLSSKSPPKKADILSSVVKIE